MKWVIDRQTPHKTAFLITFIVKLVCLTNTLQIVKVLVPIEVGADGEAPIYEDDGAKNEDMEMSSLSSSENPSTLANMNIGYLNNILKMIFY